MSDADNTDPDGPAMQRLLDVRCHLRYIANDLHTSDRTAMHMQEVARECLEKTHSVRAPEREHEARIRADERARIAKELHRMAVAETESDARSAGLHEAAMFVESDAALATAAPPRRIPVPTTATALADEMADAVRTVRAHVDGLLLQQYHRLLDSGVPPSRMVRQSVPSMRRERIVDAARPGGQWVETRTSPHEGIGQVCLEVALVDWEPGTSASCGWSTQRRCETAYREGMEDE